MLNDKYSKILKQLCKSLILLKTNQKYFWTTKLQNSFHFLADQPFGIFASPEKRPQKKTPPKMNLFPNRHTASFCEALLHLPSKIGPT